MLFISHSSRDLQVVEALVDLFRAALPLAPENIRFSSPDGFRLPGGADTDTHLRREVPAATAFVGVISYHSLRSEYVSFEFGARWGPDKTIIPLLAPGVESTILKRP
jgi:TIR domain-containing protein